MFLLQAARNKVPDDKFKIGSLLICLLCVDTALVRPFFNDSLVNVKWLIKNKKRRRRRKRESPIPVKMARYKDSADE